MLYREKALRHEPAEVTSIAEYFQWLGVKTGSNIFTGLNQVSPANRHRVHLLHNFCLGLFKHMMESVKGFLKKHEGQQPFGNTLEKVSADPGFRVLKKAYREIIQWQGKGMRNRGWSISAVLPYAL